MSSGCRTRAQDVTLFVDDSSPPDEGRGTKASFGPLSGQLVDMRPRDQQPNSRFAGVNNGGGFNPGGGLIRAGGASWGGCVLPLMYAFTLRPYHRVKYRGASAGFGARSRPCTPRWFACLPVPPEPIV